MLAIAAGFVVAIALVVAIPVYAEAVGYRVLRDELTKIDTGGTRPPFVTAAYASFAASQTTLHGVLAALIERERSGLGQHVEGNLVQGFTSLDSWNWFVYLVHQRWPDAFLANDLYDPDGTPAGVFPFLLMVAMVDSSPARIFSAKTLSSCLEGSTTAGRSHGG